MSFDALLSLSMRRFDPRYLTALAQVAVFPNDFDECGAAAVMGRGESDATGYLNVLHSHMFVKRVYDRWMVVSPEVRKIAQKLVSEHDDGKAVLRDARTAFIHYMVTEMSEWAAAPDTEGYRDYVQYCESVHRDDIILVKQLLAEEPTGNAEGFVPQ